MSSPSAKGARPSQLTFFERAAKPEAAVPAPPAPLAPVATAPVEVAPAEAAPPRSQPLTVSELTTQMKSLLERGFSRVLVKGEVSGFKRAAAGHLYFTLKDEGAVLSAVIWARGARALKFDLKDGLAVVARGAISLYPPHGKYQLAVEGIEPEGAGALALAFEQLKKKLADEGLFDPARKRPVPFLPRCIGVVTSPTGAALQDFLRVLHSRFDSLPVLIAAARVQGEGAAREIARGVRRLSESGRVDVIVVTRGGGSVEDLWAFNEEEVARAIACSRVPVVSAVGHEVDFTISDFVADLRCPTPTAAAERLAPDKRELIRRLLDLQARLRRGVAGALSARREVLRRMRAQLGDPGRLWADRHLAMADRFERLVNAERPLLRLRRARLKELAERLSTGHPRARLAEHERRVRELDRRLRLAGQRVLGDRQRELAKRRARLWAAQPGARLRRERTRWSQADQALRALGRSMLSRRRVGFQGLAARLEALSPLQVLSRGYALVKRDRDGTLVRSVEQVSPGEGIGIRLSDGGRLEAEVKATSLPGEPPTSSEKPQPD